MSQPPASAAIAGDVTRGSGAGGRDQKAARVAAAGEVSFEELSAVMLHRDEMESVMHYYFHDCRLLVIVCCHLFITIVHVRSRGHMRKRQLR